MQVNFVCNTNGSGLWSDVKKAVRILNIELNYISTNETHGELIAIFDTKSWNERSDGLIYTDRLWMKEFKENLLKLGFIQEAVNNIDYSENGMQGDDYVSMDVGEKFLKEWKLYENGIKKFEYKS